MTATSLTYLVARAHIHDRMREAERKRRVADVRPPRWVPFSFLGRFTPDVARTPTPRPVPARPDARVSAQRSG
jgi:hypothetical protein